MNEPIWIDEADVLAIHDRLLDLHGGGTGLREDSLLKSALARPLQDAAYSSGVGIIDLALLYTAGIVRNHPFVDGNKRTGFVIGILFLELNGYRFTASEADAARAVFDLAAGTLDEAGFGEFIRANSKRAD
jgi:death-on-curing protein